jgi:S-adenosylmethionine:tRNA ribosyltransferase-isomerase
MVLHRTTGRIEHRVFADLPLFLRSNDCLVLNRTRVIPAKFTARRQSGRRIQGLFVREQGIGRWTVLLKGAGRLKHGEQLFLGGSRWTLRLLRCGERGSCEVGLHPPGPAMQVLEAVGQAPLPPYIHRPEPPFPQTDELDRERYQTVYAEVPGSIAAPTAGMHFTPDLLKTIRSRGTSIADVVLHVGLGTFQPVEVEDLAEHPMHEEWYSLSADSAAMINRTHVLGGRAVAVGTTSVRVLETCGSGGHLRAQSGWTELLIYPPYPFAMTDAMVTNFHLPGSTLLALVFAFAGRDRTLDAYRCAIAQRYRFYSYGDAMLIL